MKRGIVTAVLVFICFILQTSVFELIKLAGITPNILLILISSVAVMRGQKPGMIVGFFSGLLMDIFYGSTIGGFAFLYMVLGFVDGFFNLIYYSDDNILPSSLWLFLHYRTYHSSNFFFLCTHAVYLSSSLLFC